jgi:hypothetical protein
MAVEPAPLPSESLGSYDIRKGSAGYASIMGSIGGFTVPTVILVFTVAHEEATRHPAEFTLLVGLLVLSLLGCLASAFAFSAISGEEHLTANLPPAGMYVGVGVILSIMSVVAAFEILAHIYLATATGFFVAITAGGGITGAIYNAFTVIDDWEMRVGRESIHGESEWLKSRHHAHAWAGWLSIIGCAPILLGLILHWKNVDIPLTTSSAQFLGGAGIFLTMVTIILGTIRTLHPSGKPDRGIRRVEAISLQCVTGLSLFALILSLPK